MDETKRPLLIPPEFAYYAEEHGVFDMYQRLLEQLLVHKPDEPISFLIDLLKRDNDDVPKIIILGPPAAGKRSIGKMICNKTRAAHITMENLISEADISHREEALNYINKKKAVPTELWMKIIEERMVLFDCVKKGWVMEGFPQTREQALGLQERGFYPKHCVILEAPDTVLIERASGKRVDPTTGDIYHTTFNWPSNQEIQDRLVVAEGYTEEEMVQKLILYHRYIESLKHCFGAVLQTVNADQPKADVFAQVLTFICSQARSPTPHTPRIVLLGPSGSGKAVQAALLASKYNLVNISCGHLIKQAIADETKSGKAAKNYVRKGNMVPDTIVLSIVKDRLGQLDCVTRGWVLHGYPLSREQGEQLEKQGFVPNRIFFLDVPNDSVIERLTQRYTDPITGERYHLLYNPPRTQDIKDRLERHEKDEEEHVKKRLAQYHAYYEELTDYYEASQHINADQDPHTVFETIESMIVNQLPKRI
ncbi:hypothetical protein LOTGIDRAFT_195378 [Lottia gigantea]|uniref:Nucleoside-diphosphate kinase n=1 Tax=Lottia gigantea TaxID=225164 RepID=V3Z5F9_LOTGI|nr:hypothetical protein LOTGIDRAFT_195378 [Lottia gigantea]ESO85978.1 hypothetical protein LOTGIDRAFT_195378 [Lottia gigantea]